MHSRVKPLATLSEIQQRAVRRDTQLRELLVMVGETNDPLTAAFVACRRFAIRLEVEADLVLLKQIQNT